MLTIQLPNSNPYSKGDEAADRLLAVSASPIVSEPTNDFDYCEIECQYTEYAFADASDSASYKNDRASFLFRKITAGDSIAFELYKDCAKVADLTDATYGTYYGSFTSEPLQTGFIIDWQKVLIALGPGTYQFKAVRTLAGQSVPFESNLYRLIPYADDLANFTVRLDSLQDGNILGSEVNYTDLISGGWPISIRVRGKFGQYNPLQEASKYIDSTYRSRQIQDKIIREYVLETAPVPVDFQKRFIEDAMLGNEIFITDYNITNFEILRNVPVTAEEVQEVNYSQNIRRAVYRIKFTHREDVIRKRNF